MARNDTHTTADRSPEGPRLLPKPFETKLFEILATLQYNSERMDVLEALLKEFLATKNVSMDVRHEARALSRRQMEEIGDVHRGTPEQKDQYMRRLLFRQECLLSSNIPQVFVPEYIAGKYGRFEDEFEAHYGFRLEALWLFAFTLAEFLEFKKHTNHFRDEVYKFSSKKEYADLGFVAIPDSNYIEKWRNVITVQIEEIRRVLGGRLSRREVSAALDMLSLRLEAPIVRSQVRLPSTPLLRLDRDTLVVMIPRYLTRGLPAVYESLSKKVRKITDSKGVEFEGLVKENLKHLPFKGLSFNVAYGRGFEVDAVLEFESSAWFVEITSHPPSPRSLEGDLQSVDRDLTKSIRKCLSQGKRCLRHLGEEPLSHFVRDSKRPGILIVVDGVYPQMNMNTGVKFFHEPSPVYIINWFDLRVLLDQPELARFEDFLLWRTVQPMPLICFDEKDYWAYFFEHQVDPEHAEAFRAAQRKELKVMYISARFNDKEYLENIMQQEG